MLNTLISRKAAAWFQREDCPARQIIEHIEATGRLHHARIEAIKTRPFLKIAGANKPLRQLFCDGPLIPDEGLSRLHISEEARTLFEADNAARALFEFSRIRTNGGPKTALPELGRYLLNHVADVDCCDVVKRMSYDVE